MARVLADNVDLAVATNDLAFVAHLLNRRAYLHRLSFPVMLIQSGGSGSAFVVHGGSAGGAALRYLLAQPQA